MAAGKGVSIFAGLITLVGTFLFAWTTNGGAPVDTLSGLSVVNLQDMLDYTELLGDQMWMGYATMGLFLLTILSGLMIIIGGQVRFFSILFGLIAFAQGLIILLSVLTTNPIIADLVSIEEIMMSPQVVEDMIPYVLEITTDITVGQVLLISGGFFGIIGGLMSRDD